VKYQIIHSPAVADWVAKKVELNNRHEFGACYSIGVGLAGRPVAGVVYNWFREEKFGNDIRVTIAAESRVPWARKEVLRELFSYPFEDLKCERVTAFIREGNTPSEKFCKHLGFRKEGVMRRAWDGKTNAIIYALLKHECRYI